MNVSFCYMCYFVIILTSFIIFHDGKAHHCPEIYDSIMAEFYFLGANNSVKGELWRKMNLWSNKTLVP